MLIVHEGLHEVVHVSPQLEPAEVDVMRQVIDVASPE